MIRVSMRPDVTTSRPSPFDETHGGRWLKLPGAPPIPMGNYDRCERCGALLFAGDWPWCNGRPGEHAR